MNYDNLRQLFCRKRLRNPRKNYGMAGMSNNPTVFARSVQKIADAAAPCRQVRNLLRTAGLDREAIQDPALRIPYADMMILTELAARAAKDLAFGLHVGEQVDQRSYGVVGRAVMTSPTLGEALHALARYLPIWTDVGSFQLNLDRSVAHFHWKYSNCSLPESRHDCEMTMATVMRFNRLSRGAQWEPREVWFQHAKPPEVSEHARIFRAPVRFSMPANALLLDRQLLTVPLKDASPFMYQATIEAAERLLSKASSEVSISNTVGSFIRQRLSSGEVCLEDAARHLNLSRRTLQRKLRQESASHRNLVEQARRDLSRYLLLSTGATVTEVAYALGFSEPSAFHHAFQKWHCTQPSAYRRKKVH
jgi:AraC-like DNA-binding protein